MSEYNRRLFPPMGALQVFAAAARFESFSKAGAQVGLTQSAVSRQIALLEDWLQIPLFERHGRRVTLSAAGRSYAAAIRPGLERIRNATAQAIEASRRRELTIATLPSFGMRWLAHRLPRFTARHPELIVNVATRSSAFDLAAESFDAAIHFGLPDWPGAEHHMLFRETVIPVCAPSWLRDNPVTEPADLIDKPLLRLTTRPDAWQSWFARHGLGVEPARGATFEHFMMLAQAVAAGGGVALMPTFLVAAELAAGELVAPMDRPHSGDEAYYLVHATDRKSDTALASFRAWIIEEAEELRGPALPPAEKSAEVPPPAL